MSSSVRALEAAALLLPREEREKLAQRLLSSLDRDPEVEAAWDQEIKRRVEAFEAGLYEEIPAEQVFAEARAEPVAQEAVRDRWVPRRSEQVIHSRRGER